MRRNWASWIALALVGSTILFLILTAVSIHQRRALIRWVQAAEAGGKPSTGGYYLQTEPGWLSRNLPDEARSWLDDKLGEAWIQPFDRILVVTVQSVPTENADIRRFRWVPELEELSLLQCSFSEGGLAHLRRCQEMKDLTLSGPAITAEGLVHLRGFSELEVLCYYAPAVGDKDLAHLSGFSELRELSLSYEVSNEGLAHLSGLTIEILGIAETPQGLRRLTEVEECVRGGRMILS